MPYYIYKIFQTPVRRLEKVEQHGTFPEASARAKALRGELASRGGCAVKLIFAENELGAEDMLSQLREPQPELGDD